MFVGVFPCVWLGVDRRIGGRSSRRRLQQPYSSLCRVADVLHRRILSASRLMTMSPAWFSISICDRTRPRSGLDCDRRAETIETRTRSASPGADRLCPAEFVDAGGTQARDLGEVMICQQAHHQAGGMPAARDEAAKGTQLGSLRVEMKRCGSNLCAKLITSCSLTTVGPYSATDPGT